MLLGYVVFLRFSVFPHHHDSFYICLFFISRDSLFSLDARIDAHSRTKKQKQQKQNRRDAEAEADVEEQIQTEQSLNQSMERTPTPGCPEALMHNIMTRLIRSMQRIPMHSSG